MSNKIPGPVMLDIAGIELHAEDKEILCHPQVSGLILFARNYEEPVQLDDLIKSIRAVNQDITIAVDQEGGRVQRFKQGFTRLPPMQTLGRLYQENPVLAQEAAKEFAWLMASELLAYDIDLSFAPVLDVDESFCAAIGNRSISSQPELVSSLGASFIEGMSEAGMASTGKHFPGHGSVQADSHVDSPKDSRSLKELEEHDLIPFKSLASKLDAIMPAHVIFSSIDSYPVGFSSYWLKDYLRQTLGFNGVIFSDDLSMEAASFAGDYPSRAMFALDAGCDVVLLCNQREHAALTIEFLERKNIKLKEHPLVKMKKRKKVTLTNLESDVRYRTALTLVERLHSL